MTEPFQHIPVLLDECIENLAIKPDGIYVDGTIGGGGHALRICEKLSERGTLIGIDRDRDALSASRDRLEGQSCRRILIQDDYADIKAILRQHAVGDQIAVTIVRGGSYTDLALTLRQASAAAFPGSDAASA